jgi:hypothetical protein
MKDEKRMNVINYRKPVLVILSEAKNLINFMEILRYAQDDKVLLKNNKCEMMSLTPRL